MIRIKWAGEARLRSGRLDEIASRPRGSHTRRAPLPTGWHGLDIATTVGGLPRRTMVTLTGETDEQARNFVLSLIANWQEPEGPSVAVVDLAADFAKEKVRRTGVNYEDLTVVRADKVDEGVEAARALLALADHDVVLLHGPSLDNEPKPRFAALLRQMSEAVRASDSAGLVNLGQTRADPVSQALLRFSLHADRTLRMTGEHEATVEVPADEHGRPDHMRDLVAGALLTSDITRAGNGYRVGGRIALGRRQLESMLNDDSDLVRDLESTLNREALRQRRIAAIASLPGGHADEPLEPIVLSPSPEFVVNTWFEADAGSSLPLQVGCLYDLNVRIGRPEDHGAGSWARLGKVPDFGEHDAVDLVVTVHSQDFAVAVGSRSFRLHRIDGSDLVTFAVQPLAAGECTLRLSISTARELELLHKVELSVPTEVSVPTTELEAG
jgi:RecA DNA recombination protein